MSDNGITAADWAAMVLEDLGAPVTQNNVNNMVAWIAAENQWPPPRNNPLNDGDGSGGGSGLGSYPDLATAARWAAHSLNGGVEGAGAIGQALRDNAAFSVFHAATISATWSGDHYAGTGWASATSPETMGVNNPGYSSQPQFNPEQEAAMEFAAAEGGTSYLEAMYAASQNQGSGNVAQGQSATANNNLSSEQSALAQAEQYFNQYFPTAQAQELANWAWGELTQGKNSDQIYVDLLQTPIWKQSIYGTVGAARAAAGLQPMTTDQIQSYVDNAQQLAQQAGLPKGFMSQTELTQLMGHDVGATELEDRITKGYMAAVNSPKETQILGHQYFGWEPGALASYFLNPNVAERTLQNQLVAAEVGTQAQQSGFGALSAKDSQQLSQILQAQGKIGPTTGKWDVDTSSQFAQITPDVPLTVQGPGQLAPKVTSEDLLNAAFTGLVKPTILQATQTEGTSFHGGGGGEVSSKGVYGAGFASDEGVTGAE